MIGRYQVHVVDDGLNLSGNNQILKAKSFYKPQKYLWQKTKYCLYLKEKYGMHYNNNNNNNNNNHEKL